MERLSLMLITAFVLAAGATPLARRAAASLGLMDMPAPRKVHARPTPLMGGVAIYVAFLAALLLFGDRFYVRQMVGILVGATICSLTGLLDDRQLLRALDVFDLLQQLLSEEQILLAKLSCQELIMCQWQDLGAGDDSHPLAPGAFSKFRHDVAQAPELSMPVLFVGDLELTHQRKVGPGEVRCLLQHVPAGDERDEQARAQAILPHDALRVGGGDPADHVVRLLQLLGRGLTGRWVHEVTSGRGRGDVRSSTLAAAVDASDGERSTGGTGLNRVA